MDNKKWGKRFSTIFWWSLTILPLIVALLHFIGYHFTFNSGISSASDLSSYHGMANGSFWYILEQTIGTDSAALFGNVTFPFLIDTFDNLFISLGFTDEFYVYSMLLAYMTTVQFYHLLFDFVAWLPRLVHSWLDRWCCE